MNDATETETRSGTIRSAGTYLLLITLFAFIIRFWNFWADVPHVDEVFTLELLNHSLRYVIQYSMTTDCNPPLFYIIDWISVHLFGFNTFGQRFPSVIFGTLLIPAIYIFGKEYRDQKTGLIAALAIATMGSMWYYSGFGRSYMLTALLFTCFCVYYLRLTKGKDKDEWQTERMNWIGLIAFSALLAYTHLFAIVAVGVMLSLLLFEYRNLTAFWNMVKIGIVTSPLLFLFNAILKERAITKDVAAQHWNWWGATPAQILVWSPLEFFNYASFIWIPMIVYSVWKKRSDTFVYSLAFSFAISLGTLLLLADITPVFIRYILLFIPVLCTIGLAGVLDFWEDKESMWPQEVKRNLLVTVFVLYIICQAFVIVTGFYAPKGH